MTLVRSLYSSYIPVKLALVALLLLNSCGGSLPVKMAIVALFLLNSCGGFLTVQYPW